MQIIGEQHRVASRARQTVGHRHCFCGGRPLIEQGGIRDRQARELPSFSGLADGRDPPGAGRIETERGLTGLPLLSELAEGVRARLAEAGLADRCEVRTGPAVLTLADMIDGGTGSDTVVLSKTSTALNALADSKLVNVEAIDASTATAGVTLNLANQTDGFTIVGSLYADTGWVCTNNTGSMQQHCCETLRRR